MYLWHFQQHLEEINFSALKIWQRGLSSHLLFTCFNFLRLGLTLYPKLAPDLLYLPHLSPHSADSIILCTIESLKHSWFFPYFFSWPFLSILVNHFFITFGHLQFWSILFLWVYKGILYTKMDFTLCIFYILRYYIIYITIIYSH